VENWPNLITNVLYPPDLQFPFLRCLSSVRRERSFLIKFVLLVLSLAESVIRVHTEKC